MLFVFVLDLPRCPLPYHEFATSIDSIGAVPLAGDNRPLPVRKVAILIFVSMEYNILFLVHHTPDEEAGNPTSAFPTLPPWLGVVGRLEFSKGVSASACCFKCLVLLCILQSIFLIHCLSLGNGSTQVSTLLRVARHTQADVLACANYFMPPALASSGAPQADSIPAGMYIPLGPALAAGSLSNVFGDANALFTRRALQTLGGWPEEAEYGVQVQT